MTKSEYSKLKNELVLRPKNWVAVIVLLEIIGLFLGAACLCKFSWVDYTIAQVLFAIAFFQSFALMHEAVHNNASTEEWGNFVMGHIASIGCGLPFLPWRYIHREHHVWTGNHQKDPTARSLVQWRAQGVPKLVQWTWKWWVPLASIIQHYVFWTYPMRLDDRRKAWRCWGSVGFLGLAYLGIVWTFGWRLLYLAPAVILYLLATELVNLPHHVGMPSTEGRWAPWEQWHGTRSCLYPVGVSEFLVLNFNFHTEHHLYPQIPWYGLRAARQKILNILGSKYTEELGVAWNWRNRRLNPSTMLDSLDYRVEGAIKTIVNSGYMDRWVSGDRILEDFRTAWLTMGDEGVLVYDPAGATVAANNTDDGWLIHGLARDKSLPKIEGRLAAKNVMIEILQRLLKSSAQRFVTYHQTSNPATKWLCEDFVDKTSAGVATEHINVYRVSSDFRHLNPTLGAVSCHIGKKGASVFGLLDICIANPTTKYAIAEAALFYSQKQRDSFLVIDYDLVNPEIFVDLPFERISRGTKITMDRMGLKAWLNHLLELS